MSRHTVEKIGGTSIADTETVLANVLLPEDKRENPYQRIIVLSAYAGITNLLLEDKKTGEPGVYGLYSRSELDWSWGDGLSDTARRMCEVNQSIFDDPALLEQANQFALERIESVRSCLIDLQRLCASGHFRLERHLLTVREMLAGVGEAHSAFNTALLLRQHGVEARCIDLTGWRDERELDIRERISSGLGHVDLRRELPIVTGYAQCRDGLISRYGRGYTEVTFSQVAALTDAREALIHKEYHLSSADPLVVGADKVRKIGRTNYDVADQLSNMGMEAVHPSAAKVLRQADIPLRIRNTFEPDDPGTLICGDYVSDEPCVEIITGRKGLYALKLFDQDMVGVSGVDRRILEVIEKNELRIVSKDLNANTVTHFLSGNLSRARRAISALQEQFPNADIDLQKVAFVSVIGSDLSVDGLLARALTGLAETGIEVLALHQGMRQVDIQIVINESDYEPVIRVLHKLLIESRRTAADRARDAA